MIQAVTSIAEVLSGLLTAAISVWNTFSSPFTIEITLITTFIGVNTSVVLSCTVYVSWVTAWIALWMAFTIANNFIISTAEIVISALAHTRGVIRATSMVSVAATSILIIIITGLMDNSVLFAATIDAFKIDLIGFTAFFFTTAGFWVLVIVREVSDFTTFNLGGIRNAFILTPILIIVTAPVITIENFIVISTFSCRVINSIMGWVIVRITCGFLVICTTFLWGHTLFRVLIRSTMDVAR